MFSDFAEFIQDLAFKNMGYSLTDFQITQFCNYGDLLLEWNQRMNLTRIIEPHEIILKHFIDSIIIANFFTASDLADLGSGAGFPGIPLKILRPELNLVLIDSLKKRVGFLEAVIKELNLNQITAVHARFEDIGKNSLYRGRFDIVTSRAVARLPILLEYALPFLKLNGLFIAPKGSQAEEELAESRKALKVLGAEVEKIERYNLGEGAEHRVIIMIRKVKETPSQYPRQAGKPVKSPII